MLQDEINRLPTRQRAIRSSVSDEASIHHVSGQATFVDDLPDTAGTLHVAVGVAPIAQGQITRLDLKHVAAKRDVVLVLTADDIPGDNDASPERTNDHPIICAGNVAYHRQVLFAVVARSRHAARAAVKLARPSTTSALPVTDL
ncbi:MAG: xanthine dehydrogenase molybdopterin binding subunit, partial [Alphaproteobacteria bacterium]